MFNQIFVPFLVEEGLLTKEQGKEILEQQKHARIRMGVLAVEEKMMTKENADHVNRLQALHNARFGDIAVARGYLTADQVDILLSKQAREHIVLKQLITDKGYITGDKFDLALGTLKTALGVSYDDFVLLQDRDVEAFMHIIADMDSTDTVLWEYIKLFVNTTIRFVDREIRIGKAYTASNIKFKHTVWQRSSGETDGEFTFVLATNDTSAACNFGSAYGKVPIDAMDEDGQDAVKEFLNCVGGLLTADLENKQVKSLMIDVPEYQKDHVLSQSLTIIPITLSFGDFYLTVIDPTKANPVNKKRFIMVDDSKIARHLLKTIVEDAGHEVIAEASNGLDGYDKYRALKPDFITLDVTMPILNGIECLKMILNANDAANVIMVTSVGKDSLVAEAMKIGAKAVIVKPIEKSEVLSKINALL
ncbi:MAG: response regulator [Defluviitaleaceae bacterium]|nr:response regulator [Defluviitaleaceae bacterium]MCL2239149.1 response regulator [Defluviitaleaceae bacterium]